MFNLDTPCSFCGSKSTYYVLDVLTDVKDREYWLCDNCMAKYDKNGTLKLFAVPILQSVTESVDKFVTGILEKIDQPPKTDIQCPKCGTTLSQFQKTKRVGCADDYDLFGLGPVLEKYHKANKHVGKVPSTYMTAKDRENQLKKLRSDMDAAVKAERYEEAAKLRDQIKGLTK